jgi:Trypsin-like peptidase domain
MPNLSAVIARVRESVVAILRVHLERPQSIKKGKVRPAKYQVGIAGSGFCVVEDRCVVTAFHVLNGGSPREANDKFYAFVVPQNADPIYYFPVVSFPAERPRVDMAVLEIGPCSTQGVRIPAIPVSFADHVDGTRVVTAGFPAPETVRVNLDEQGNFLGGQFFLKSHANEGIISAQYPINGMHFYELNVGWHNGESGGPIVAFSDHPAAFSLMQHYRNVKAPIGTLAGPRRGIALASIQQDLTPLGVSVI